MSVTEISISILEVIRAAESKYELVFTLSRQDFELLMSSNITKLFKNWHDFIGIKTFLNHKITFWLSLSS